MIGIQFVFAFCVALVGWAQCYSDEEVKIKYTQMFVECSAGTAVSKEDIASLERQELPENDNVKCALACAYRKLDAMDDKGMFTPTENEKTKSIYDGAPEDKLAKLRQVSEVCTKVNNLPVSDGDKGCERAGLVYKCMHEEAKKAGVTIY